MPGAFTHMIAADQATKRLDDAGLDFPATLLLRYPQWLQSGAVGPDYPYLHHAITSHDPSDNWADRMHYKQTGAVVREGVKILRARFIADAKKIDFMRACAWLFGYASHVIMDASIHPVVRAVVGDYTTLINRTKHRICEMCMDSYIYKETYDDELTNSEWVDYLRDLNESDGMSTSVVSLWREMLQKTYPQEYLLNEPKINEWHKEYVNKLDKADVNVGLFRHAAEELAVLYVPVKEISRRNMDRYIKKVLLPKNRKYKDATLPFEDIFRFGVDNVERHWRLIADVISGKIDSELPELKNWNLDTGALATEVNGDATLWF